MVSKSKSTGVIRNLFIKQSHGQPMQSVETISAVAGKGLEGDQAYGRKSRQVLIVDLDQVQALSLKPGELRENITLYGIAVDSLHVGSRLQSGDVIIRIVEICNPCERLEDIRPGLMDASKGKRGMLAVIERDGILQPDMPIWVL
jgi:MOSC domain-containing protein YiiM